MELRESGILDEVEVEIVGNDVAHTIEHLTMFTISEERVGEGLLRGGAVPEVHEDPLVLVIVEGDKLGQTVVLRFLDGVGRELVLGLRAED
jgi:hypothetical protein